MRYEQIERLLLQAAIDDALAEQLARSGVSAGARYLLDAEELELMAILQRDEGVLLHALLRAIRAGMDTALLAVMEPSEPGHSSSEP